MLDANLCVSVEFDQDNAQNLHHPVTHRRLRQFAQNPTCEQSGPWLAMDYILVDGFVVPPEQQPFFSEQLVLLPGCYQINDSQGEISAHTPSRAECSLPQEGFVFCCFNNSYKITPTMFDVWMRLLKAVPGSVIWLLEGNRFVPPNLRREAEARAVAAAKAREATVALATGKARLRAVGQSLRPTVISPHARTTIWLAGPGSRCTFSTGERRRPRSWVEMMNSILGWQESRHQGHGPAHATGKTTHVKAGDPCIIAGYPTICERQERS